MNPPITQISRRNSLRLPAQPPPIPIPPSLRESPYLNSPAFKRELSTPRLPSDEDEKWLQDTVPIGSPLSATEGGFAAKANLDRRGSIAQLSRHSYKPPIIITSGPTVSDDSDNSSSSSSFSTVSRGRSKSSRHLSHSLAPPLSPPIVRWPHLAPSAYISTRPLGLGQTRSEPNIVQLATSTQTEHSYFTHVESIRY
ncbi:hypothetical protein B0H34DRAFT_302664 [Crassisporium funariophilum]|nr:hypothetical protein B0H34DRAFT_302664 [Crassisporium funariophilum]